MALDSKVGQPCLRAAAVVRLQREHRDMKSKLSAVLVVAGVRAGRDSGKCHLDPINPGATTSSVPGAVLFDDFGSARLERIEGNVAIAPALSRVC
jgi:hypothetical protein